MKSFHAREKRSGKLGKLGKLGNWQEAYWSKCCWLILKSRNSTPQYLIERDIDLHQVIEYLKKKMQIFYDQSKQIHIDIWRIF